MPNLYVYNYKGEKIEDIYFDKDITHKDIKRVLKDHDRDSYVSISTEIFDEELFLGSVYGQQ